MARISYSAKVTNKHGEEIGITGGDSIEEAFTALEKAVRDRDLVWDARIEREKKIEDDGIAPEDRPQTMAEAEARVKAEEEKTNETVTDTDETGPSTETGLQ